MRGNAARPVSASMLCLCKSRARRGLAARMLVVHSGSERRPIQDACLPRGAPTRLADTSMAGRSLRRCALMAFLYRLQPPRPTFAQDMSSAEANVMQRHVAYWQDLLNRDVARPSARCSIPRTPGDSACSTWMMSGQPERSGRATRRCRPAPAPTSSCRWNSCGPAEGRAVSRFRRAGGPPPSGARGRLAPVHCG